MEQKKKPAPTCPHRQSRIAPSVRLDLSNLIVTAYASGANRHSLDCCNTPNPRICVLFGSEHRVRKGLLLGDRRAPLPLASWGRRATSSCSTGHNGVVHLELMREKSKRFPDLATPERYTSARIWHCTYQTLAPVAALVTVTRLKIATYPDDTGRIDLHQLVLRDLT